MKCLNYLRMSKKSQIVFQFAVICLAQTVLCETDCSNAAKQEGLKVISMCNYEEVTDQEVVLDMYDSAASGLESCKCDVISNAVSATFTVSDYEELFPGSPGCGSSVIFSITGDTGYVESYECFGGDFSADSKYGDQVDFQWNRGNESSNSKYCLKIHSTSSMTVQCSDGQDRNFTKPVFTTPEMTTAGVSPTSKEATTPETATTSTTILSTTESTTTPSTPLSTTPITIHSTTQSDITSSTTQPTTMTTQSTTVSVSPSTTTMIPSTTATTPHTTTSDTQSTTMATDSSTVSTTRSTMTSTSLHTTTQSATTVMTKSVSMTTEQSTTTTTTTYTTTFINLAFGDSSQNYNNMDPKVIIYAGSGAAAVVAILFGIIAIIVIYRRTNGKPTEKDEKVESNLDIENDNLVNEGDERMSNASSAGDERAENITVNFGFEKGEDVSMKSNEEEENGDNMSKTSIESDGHNASVSVPVSMPTNEEAENDENMSRTSIESDEHGAFVSKTSFQWDESSSQPHGMDEDEQSHSESRKSNYSVSDEDVSSRPTAPIYAVVNKSNKQFSVQSNGIANDSTEDKIITINGVELPVVNSPRNPFPQFEEKLTVM